MGSSVILPTPGQPTTGPDPNFKSGSSPALVTFGLLGIGPPSALYIQRDDALLLQATARLAPGQVTFNARILMAPIPRGGQPDTPADAGTQLDPRNSNVIEQFVEVISLPTAGQPQSVTRQLAEGYLLSLAAMDSGGLTLFRGQTFAKAHLIRNQGGLASVRQVLFEDYVIPNNPVGWPGGRQLGPTEGNGWVHSVQQPNPGAGADWTLAMVASQRMRVNSFTAQLLTSAAVANRNIEIIVDDGVNVVWRTSAAASVAASTTQQVSATGTNNPTGVVTTDFQMVIPPGLIIEPNWRIRSLTGNIQAGDQWSNIWFNVEEWLESV